MELTQISHRASLDCQRWNGKIIRMINNILMQYEEQVLEITKLNYDVANKLSGKPS